MEETKSGGSFFDTLARVIVDKRNIIFLFYAVALVFSIFASGWVSVCNDLTAYLPESTETRRGLTIMNDELITYGTARVMVSHVDEQTARDLAKRIEGIEGITSAELGSGKPGVPSDEPETAEDREQYLKGTNALISVTFAGEEQDEISKTAINEMKAMLEPYDAYVSSQVGYSRADTLNSEMGIILVIAAVIIVLVLLLTSRSYAEIPVLVLTFGAAALLNKGTNFIFGEISFVSDSVTVVLQLALAIDYAIILLHRFTEEWDNCGDDRQACITALSASIPAISASSLTTISGLGAMMFMQFKIGFDMGMVLIKAIVFSLLSVFTLMPGLLMLFGKAIRSTQHRSFIPRIDRWGKLVVKLRYVGVALFAISLVGGFLLSQKTPYGYGYTLLKTDRQNESQIAEEKVNSTFGSQNIMALLVPKGDYDREKALLKVLENHEEIDYAMGLANIEAMDGYTLTDPLTPRQFSEMTDVDYDLIQLLYTAYAAQEEDYGQVVSGIDTYSVPLMDMFLFLYDQMEEGFISLDAETEESIEDLHTQLTDARLQMLGETCSRMVLNLNLPEEGEETFAFLDTLHEEAARYYNADQVYLVGNSTSDADLAASFAHDNLLVTLLSLLFVVLVLLFTFQSVGLPILLIAVIQGSIFLNFSFPTLTDTPIFFMSFLVVTSIQMGANIDYAIVISSRYTEMKETMPHKDAIIRALDLAFPTILTSGSILTAAAFLIGKLSTEPAVVGIGQCLCRGTLISIFLVMFILPQILLLGDMIVEKTHFDIKVPEVAHTWSGPVLVHGHIRGRVNGVVDATMHGIIRGDVTAIMDTGAVRSLPEEEETPDET